LGLSATGGKKCLVDGAGLPTPRPGRFTPRKEPGYPLFARQDWPRGRYGRVRRIGNPFSLPRFEPRTLLPVPGRYINYATSQHPPTPTSEEAQINYRNRKYVYCHLLESHKKCIEESDVTFCSCRDVR